MALKSTLFWRKFTFYVRDVKLGGGKVAHLGPGLVYILKNQNLSQMEPQANAFERCFALISLLDIFQLPEVIFLEAVNHHSNQVGRFICLLLCQCTSVNCPAVKRLLIGKLQMKYLLCTVLLSHSLEICQ